MGGEAVALPRIVCPSAVRGVVAGCRLESLARVLSRLLPRPVTPTNVRDRAVGLGLPRLSPDGAAPRLPPEKASRLLLDATSPSGQLYIVGRFSLEAAQTQVWGSPR
jgi:hypothetical protein